MVLSLDYISGMEWIRQVKSLALKASKSKQVVDKYS